jgi:hypothetical protein
MKRLRLQADALTVESFSPGADEQGSAALEFLATRPQVCDPFTLPPRCA